MHEWFCLGTAFDPYNTSNVDWQEVSRRIHMEIGLVFGKPELINRAIK